LTNAVIGIGCRKKAPALIKARERLYKSIVLTSIHTLQIPVSGLENVMAAGLANRRVSIRLTMSLNQPKILQELGRHKKMALSGG
jgi:hypothetical protein